MLGILGGGLLGAVVGGALEMVLRAWTHESFGGGSLATPVIAGALAGAAIGVIVGSLTGLPAAPADPTEATLGPDPVQQILPAFLIPPVVAIVEAILIVALGSLLLSLTKTNAVYAALVATVLIAIVATVLAQRPEPPSRREIDSHLGH